MNNAAATYRAFAFHPDLGTEVASGTIHFQPGTLTFTCEAGKVDLPLNTVQLRFEESRIFFRDPNQPEWRVYTPDFEILEDRAMMQNTNTRLQAQNYADTDGSRGGLWKLAGISAAFVGAFMLVVIAIFWLSGFALDYAVTKVPASHDKEMGAEVLKHMREKDLIVDDPQTVALLKNLADRIVPAEEKKKFQFEFFVLSTPLPNAFAAPGGNIFVTTGLLKMVDKPEELAGVLAHEITHVTQRHTLRQSISRMGTFAALRLLSRSNRGFVAAVTAGSGQLVLNGFSQKFENEADDGGWDYLVKANIDPRGLETSLQKLEEKMARILNSTPELERASLPKVLSDHPPTGDRIKRLQNKWQSLKKKSGFAELPKLTTPQ